MSLLALHGSFFFAACCSLCRVLNIHLCSETHSLFVALKKRSPYYIFFPVDNYLALEQLYVVWIVKKILAEEVFKLVEWGEYGTELK